MEVLKKQRRKEKCAISRLQSKLNRYVAEQDKQEVIACIDNLKKQFILFETVHESIHDCLEDDDEIIASDEYLIEIMDEYSDCLSAANTWLEGAVHIPIVQANDVHVNSQNVSDSCESTEKEDHKHVSKVMMSSESSYDTLDKPMIHIQECEDDYINNDQCMELFECETNSGGHEEFYSEVCETVVDDVIEMKIDDHPEDEIDCDPQVMVKLTRNQDWWKKTQNMTTHQFSTYQSGTNKIIHEFQALWKTSTSSRIRRYSMNVAID